MLQDPQSLVIAATTYSLPATSRGTNESTYQSAEGNVKLTIKHSYGARTRRLVRLDYKKIAADPITAVNRQISMSAYVVMDLPKVGFTVAEATDVVTELLQYLNASSGAKTAAVLGGES